MQVYLRLGSIAFVAAVACSEAQTPALVPPMIATDAGPRFAPRPACETPLDPLPASVAPVRAVVDREVRAVALDLIATATACLDVYQFEFVRSGSVIDIRAALIAAARRGVAVRVFVDEEVEATAAQVDALVAAGIDAKLDTQVLRTHLKMIAADGNRILIGSTNFSGASFDFNHETNLLVRSPTAVAFFMEYLLTLWDSPKHDPDPSVGPTTDPSAIAWVDGGHVALALPAFEAAATRIDIILYGINFDPADMDNAPYPLVHALADAATRGVMVRVLLENSDFNTGLNELNERTADFLKANGVSIRFDAPDVVTHAKLLLVDDRALVGTNNWGYGGLVRDHEAGVMTSHIAAVQSLSTYFDAQWSAGRAW